MKYPQSEFIRAGFWLAAVALVWVASSFPVAGQCAWGFGTTGIYTDSGCKVGSQVFPGHSLDILSPGTSSDYVRFTVENLQVLTKDKGFLVASARGQGASRSAVVQNDVLFNLYAQGHDSTGFGPAAVIRMAVDGTVNSGKVPGRIDLLTMAADGSFNEAMRINSQGSVGIGTTNPGTFKLAVEGNIAARDVVVTNAVPFPDYVFQPGYQLRPLSEVDEYIRTHRHLPEIPSEAEVKRNGVSLGEMQVKLLAKVEELTLHLIQQDKENRQLRNRISQLEIRAAESGAAGSAK